MTRHPCSGCGLRSCEGECFLECPADYPDEEVAAPRSFWDRVDVRGPDECWPWNGARDSNGYGRFYFGGRPGKLAHRHAWELMNGLPAGDLHACHSCDNPSCVNPAHIWLGTPADNMHDRDAKGRHFQTRKTHCPQGHPYDVSNTYVDPTNRRKCRICSRASVVKARKAKAYVPSPEYLAWIGKIDGDPLRHLEPKRKVA